MVFCFAGCSALAPEAFYPQGVAATSRAQNNIQHRTGRDAIRTPGTGPALSAQAPRELVQPVKSLLNVRQAGGVTEAKVIVRAKSNAGHRRDLFLFEQLRAEVGRPEAGLRNVREKIKRASGIAAGNARNTVQFFPRVGAAFVILGEPLGQMVL